MLKIMDTLGKMVVGAALTIIALTVVVAVKAPETVQETRSDITVSAPGRSYVPADNEPLYAVYVPESAVNWDTGESYSADGDVILALIDMGAVGAINDGDDGFIYAHVGTVADTGWGTVTVTAFGLRYCTDDVNSRCTGTEFDPWSNVQG